MCIVGFTDTQVTGDARYEPAGMPPCKRRKQAPGAKEENLCLHHTPGSVEYSSASTDMQQHVTKSCSSWEIKFKVRLDREMGFDPGAFGRFNVAALAQPHLKLLFVCLFVTSHIWLAVAEHSLIRHLQGWKVIIYSMSIYASPTISRH